MLHFEYIVAMQLFLANTTEGLALLEIRSICINVRKDIVFGQ